MSESHMNGGEHEALAAVRATREEAARRAMAPWWYHVSLGLLLGALSAAMAGPIELLIAVEIGVLVSITLLVRAYRRHTGFWIPGYRAGRTRWVAISSAVIGGGAMLAGVWFQRHGVAWAPIAAGLFLAPFMTLRGYAWEAAYRRDLGVSG